MATEIRDTQLMPFVTKSEEMAAPAALFRSFGDPTRLVILGHLQFGEHRVIDLVKHLGLSQSTVSKHLACLKDTGMVISRAEGRASIYFLTHPAAIVGILSAAERILALTGNAVQLCPLHHDVEMGH